MRPPQEVAKISIKDAVAVPLYIPETRTDPVSLIKRYATWSNGGFWVGGEHMIPYEPFESEVRAQLPKDGAPGVVAVCSNGLRCRAAAGRLAEWGYPSVAWLKGGLNDAKVGDMPTLPEGRDPRYGGIGGLSEQLGWTKVQRENGDPAFIGGFETILKGAALLLALNSLLFAAEYVNVLVNGPAA